MAESILKELKRRNVIKVAMAYLVLAWVVLQVTSEAVPALHLPDWVTTLVFFLGAIGFPFVLVFSWIFELTPEGLKRANEVAPNESITQYTGQKLNLVITTLLVLALGYFIYESRFSDRHQSTTEVAKEIHKPEEPPPEAKKPTAHKEATVSRLNELEGASIAVLPFVNMSSDPEQEFFSDGISEEILNVLAKIPKLHVTSRSSAFAFKGKEINLSEVAQKLGVANILEGSVRKAGNKVRITAQLIEAETDKHLWSETYDRELTDIFRIQDEISSAIVAALKDKLNIAEVTLQATSSVDLEAHEAYLKGRYLVEQRQLESLQAALVEFDKAIAIQPNYANAWMGKARSLIYLSEFSYGNIPLEVAVERAQLAIDRAMEINPDLAENYAVQGLIYRNQNDLEAARRFYKKAIGLNPNYSTVYTWLGNATEAPQERLDNYLKAYRLNPVSLLAGSNYASMLIRFGRLDEALRVLNALRQIDDQHFMLYNIARQMYTEKGQFGKATFYAYKAYLGNPRINYMFNYTSGLADLGLTDEAFQVADQSDFPEQRHYYRNNQELYISEVRNVFPRSDNDTMGIFFRAFAEWAAKDYRAVVALLDDFSYCEDCFLKLASHKLLGNDELFQTLYQNRLAAINKAIKGLERPNSDWFHEQIKLYLINDQIDEAMVTLEKLLDRGLPMRFHLKVEAFYEILHKHPKWADLMRKNQQLIEREQKIYLDLMAADQKAIETTQAQEI